MAETICTLIFANLVEEFLPLIEDLMLTKELMLQDLAQDPTKVSLNWKSIVKQGASNIVRTSIAAETYQTYLGWSHNS